MPKKLSIDYIKDICFKRGFELVKIEYIQNKRYLLLRCLKGHITQKKFYYLNKGTQCVKCFSTAKLDIISVNNFLKTKDIILLDSTLINTKYKHNFKCTICHYIWQTSVNNIKYHHTGCSACKGTVSYSTEYCHAIAKINRWKFLDNYYNNYTELHNWECNLGHIIKRSLINIKKSARCYKCLGKRMKSIEDMHYIAKIKNGLCLSIKYKFNTKLLWKCHKNEHEPFLLLYTYVKQGQWCPECSMGKNYSKGEVAVREYVKNLYPDTIKWSNFIPGRKFELDIYVPSLKKAIEYDGRFHLTESQIKADNFKNQYCQKVGITLLRIQHKDYRKNKNNVLNRVKTFLQD